MKAMETIEDLIEEAKVRSVWWGLCIFSLTYFLTHTSKSMWMNLPLAILILCGLRILFNQIEFRWKVLPAPRQSQLSYLNKKQLSLNDPRLSSVPPPPRWKKKIDSPVVEAAMNDFIDKILNDFVINLWYSVITPDREAPELIRAVIMDALGEISVRVKEINIVDLLTRDIVDLIGDHLESFRRNQAAIGTDVMKTLSSEERDERLKFHLMASGELYPALLSPESEYKVLQKIVAGILSVVLRPREAQCPLVRTIAREIVTCLVVQPLLNLASPERINEVIEIIINVIKEGKLEQFSGEEQNVNPSSLSAFDDQAKGMNSKKANEQKPPSVDYKRHPELPCQQHSADWARMLEVATQRRTEVLTPENLENMWTKGRNYKKKEYKKSLKKGSLVSNSIEAKQKCHSSVSGTSTGAEEKTVALLPPKASIDKQRQVQMPVDFGLSASYEEERHNYELGLTNDFPSDGNRNRLKRSNSTSDLNITPETRLALLGVGEGPLITDFYKADFIKHKENSSCDDKSPNIALHKESQHCPKLKCRVLGAYFEKLGSKSFAVYSIAVTDTEEKTWFVKRRYSNFERLHRQLKEIPNYNLQLPPKRIFSSSTEDAFVHRRCIKLDKYLQDLLSIANVAEQHEVWDFLSASSKNYSFGKSSSVMKTLAVNVDDAMDDIVRQFKGVSDGLMRKVVGSPLEENDPAPARHLPWSVHEINTHLSRENATESMNSSISDNEDIEKLVETQGEGRIDSQANGWHSDNELDSKQYPPRVVRRLRGPEPPLEMENDVKANYEVRVSSDSQHVDPSTSLVHNPTGMPPEWMPPNVSVPILNLVDKVFQLNRRGWLRRQVFWISKQILQLIMEDAVDDWLLREVCWLRNEDTVAHGIRWAQDILWPNGIFFTRVNDSQEASDETNPSERTSESAGQLGGIKVTEPSSFEQQLEAARRASEIKKFLFDGAPTALVSLVGHKQYRRCARDIFYFTQSNVCIKQLTFAILELLLRTVFPELQDLLRDIRENMHKCEGGSSL